MRRRPCLECRKPTSFGPRCEEHALPDVGRDRALRREHDAVRAVVLSEETTCWRCGLPGTSDDPLTFDHVIPRALGGETSRANGRAAHRSCNSSAGATVRANPPGGRAIFAGRPRKQPGASARTQPRSEGGVSPLATGVSHA